MALDLSLKILKFILISLLVVNYVFELVIDHSFLVFHHFEQAADGGFTLLFRNVLLCLIFKNLIHVVISHELRDSFRTFSVLFLEPNIKVRFFKKERRRRF
jgi:hypothetical protein